MEGQTILLSGECFFSSFQTTNRDLTTAIVSTFFLGKQSAPYICDCFCGTGARGLRLLRAIQNSSLVGVDKNECAIAFSLQNSILNKLSSQCKFVCEDVHTFLTSQSTLFDVIECDPFGDCLPLISVILKSLRADGLLCLSFTNTAVLFGDSVDLCSAVCGINSCARPHVAPKELGLRLAISSTLRVIASCNRGCRLIASWAFSHGCRIIVQVTETFAVPTLPSDCTDNYLLSPADLQHSKQVFNCSGYLHQQLQDSGRVLATFFTNPSTDAGEIPNELMFNSSQYVYCGYTWLGATGDCTILRSVLDEITSKCVSNGSDNCHVDKEQLSLSEQMENVLTVQQNISDLLTDCSFHAKISTESSHIDWEVYNLRLFLASQHKCNKSVRLCPSAVKICDHLNGCGWATCVLPQDMHCIKTIAPEQEVLAAISACSHQLSLARIHAAQQGDGHTDEKSEHLDCRTRTVQQKHCEEVYAKVSSSDIWNMLASRDAAIALLTFFASAVRPPEVSSGDSRRSAGWAVLGNTCVSVSHVHVIFVKDSKCATSMNCFEKLCRAMCDNMPAVGHNVPHDSIEHATQYAGSSHLGTSNCLSLFEYEATCETCVLDWCTERQRLQKQAFKSSRKRANNCEQSELRASRAAVLSVIVLCSTSHTVQRKNTRVPNQCLILGIDLIVIQEAIQAAIDNFLDTGKMNENEVGRDDNVPSCCIRIEGDASVEVACAQLCCANIIIAAVPVPASKSTAMSKGKMEASAALALMPSLRVHSKSSCLRLKSCHFQSRHQQDQGQGHHHRPSPKQGRSFVFLDTGVCAVIDQCKLDGGAIVATALYCAPKAHVQLFSTVIHSCSEAGVVGCGGCYLYLHNCSVSMNGRSGVYLRDHCHAVLTASTRLCGNVRCGLECFGSSGTINMADCVVCDNQAGGVLVSGSHGTIKSCDISSNYYANVSIQDDSRVELSDCVISCGQASGVLIKGQNTVCTMVGCSVFENALLNVEDSREQCRADISLENTRAELH